MGIKDQVAGMTQKAQEGVKMTSVSFLLISLRLISGFFLGLTLALVGQELTQFGNFSLIFMTIVIMGIFLKMTQGWTFTKLLVFDLICVLVIQLLKMYILVAP